MSLVIVLWIILESFEFQVTLTEQFSCLNNPYSIFLDASLFVQLSLDAALLWRSSSRRSLPTSGVSIALDADILRRLCSTRASCCSRFSHARITFALLAFGCACPIDCLFFGGILNANA
ncbi:hypothetical protein AVEN_141040-1 [Araneus ventricosus]|uniref:Uncharacterized protein n=1 Tax=Araneus ventricosus TaxID=182803 RepID=A0A4Y2QGR3_ARAVE|nr:hypothetical protein AVEN_141040-1 [Araneus ventricosus]